MQNLPEPGVEAERPGTRGRIQIRLLIGAALAVILAGGAYVAFFGSPNRDRAAIDSPDNPRDPILQHRPDARPAPK